MARSSLGLVVRRTLTTDGYLHKTKIPTYHFQQSLPKLPLPKLSETMQRYIDSATPLSSPEELENTKRLAKEFESHAGKTLHDLVAMENKQHYSSYIAEPWFDMYYRFREPLPLNMNPQLTMRDDPDPAKHNQVARTASLIHASVAFYRTLRDRQLIPDLYHTKPTKSKTPRAEAFMRLLPEKISWFGAFALGAFPLDMSQYKSLFKTTRIPQRRKDTQAVFEEAEARHVVIQRGNAFYTMRVLNDDGTAVPEAKLAGALQAIVNEPVDKNSPPVGIFSSMHRDAWAETRDELLTSPVNQASIKAIDSALFAVCLEDSKPGAPPLTPDEEIPNEKWNEITRCMLHGNGRNRWFDKSFQLIVTENGKAAVNFEHAWGDGVAVLRYFDSIFQESTATPAAKPQSGHSYERLKFDLNEGLKARATKAAEDFDKFMDSAELRVLQSRTMTTKILNQLKMATDGSMQMAFQLAYFHLFGKNASTYESASTAGFKHGRTETIRSCTLQSDKFVRAFCTPGVSQQEREKAMREAISNHSKIAKEGLMGKGWDRHLYALKAMAEREKLPVPEFFQDPVYQRLAKIILSTSTLSSPALDGGGFGPVNDECYGIGYGIRDIGGRFVLMTYKKQTQGFLDALEKSMGEMVTVASGKNI